VSLHSLHVTEPVFNWFVSCTKNLVFLVTKRKEFLIPNVYSDLNFFFTIFEKKKKRKKERFYAKLVIEMPELSGRTKKLDMYNYCVMSHIICRQ